MLRWNFCKHFVRYEKLWSTKRDKRLPKQSCNTNLTFCQISNTFMNLFPPKPSVTVRKIMLYIYIIWMTLIAETSKNGSLIIKIYNFVHDPHFWGVALLFLSFMKLIHVTTGEYRELKVISLRLEMQRIKLWDRCSDGSNWNTDQQKTISNIGIGKYICWQPVQM